MAASRFKRLAQLLENFIVSAHPRILAVELWPFNSGSCVAIFLGNDAEEIAGISFSRG